MLHFALQEAWHLLGALPTTRAQFTSNWQVSPLHDTSTLNKVARRC